MDKNFQPSVSKGLLFLRHEMEDLLLNLVRQNSVDNVHVLRKEHQFNLEKLNYWIEHLKSLEKKAVND